MMQTINLRALGILVEQAHLVFGTVGNNICSLRSHVDDWAQHGFKII
jgi:hypothetical protein